MSGARVVLLGGSGLIGRALLAAWSGRGDELVVLSRRPEAVGGLPVDARAAPWRPREPSSYATALDGAAVVVNLAGENVGAGRWTAARKAALRDSRVAIGEALASAVATVARPPGVLLQGSAVGYYGDCREQPVDERTPPGNDFLARLAVDWEASTAAVEALGVRRVVLRTGLVLARQGGALPRMLPAFRLGLGGPFGRATQMVPWIHLADEVGAIDFLRRHPTASGAFDLTAPEPLDNRSFARALGVALGRPAFLPAPAFALRLALGEMADLLLVGQRALPRRLLELGYAFRFPTAAQAFADLVR